MFCKNCGKELPDGTKFCGACGADLTEATVRVNPPSESEVNTDQNVNTGYEPAAETPAESAQENFAYVQEPSVAHDTPAQPQETYSKPPKKKGKKLLIGIVIAIVALAAVVASVFLIPALREKATDIIVTFSSPETQQLYAYKKLVGNAVDEYSEAVDKQVEEYAGKGEISVELGDTAKDLLSELDLGLEEIESLAITYDTNANSDIMSLDLGLSYNGENLIKADAVIDIKNSVITASVPDLCDKPVKIDMSEYADEDELTEMTEVLTSLTEDFSDKKFLDELTAKYVELALKKIDDVEKEKDTLKVGDVSVKATLLTTEFNEKMLGECLTEVLKEVKKDKDIEKYLTSVFELSDMDGEEYYDEFVSEIDNILDEIDEEWTSTDALFTLKTWVNSSFEILAVEISADDGVLLIASVENKNKTAAEIYVEEDDEKYFIIEAEGSKKRDVYSGDIKVSVEGESVLDVKYEDIDSKADSFVGKITISSDAISDLLDSELASMAELTLEGKAKDKKNTFTIGIGAASAQLGKLTVTSETHKFEEHKLHKNAVEDIEEWAETLDVEGFMEKLSDVGIYDIISSIMDSSYSDDYDYEDIYDYDYDYDYDEDYDYYEDYTDYDYGYDAGYLDGFYDGLDEDYENTYGESADDDSADYMDGYDDGYEDGYNDGIED